jgi:uncharacterized membrane protein
MSILGILIVLIIIGVILYVVNSVIPMDPKIKLIANVVVIIAVLIWLLQAFGLVDGRTFGRPLRSDYLRNGARSSELANASAAAQRVPRAPQAGQAVALSVG